MKPTSLPLASSAVNIHFTFVVWEARLLDLINRGYC
jgi:hypothetical protein